MLFNTLVTSSVLVATALAAAQPAPYLLKRGSISFNDAFGLGLMKRQAGYQPTQTQCGPGTDCASSCGTGYVQCASNDDQLHCYSPPNGDSCCTDGTGNSCQVGYYCTDDSSGNTWCCPNGMNLASCAAFYTLTGSLSSESTAAPSSTAAPTSPATVSASSVTTTSALVASSSAPAKVSYTQLSNGTAPTTTTSTTAVQFTGAANKIVYGGLPALALAAGAVLAL